MRTARKSASVAPRLIKLNTIDQYDLDNVHPVPMLVRSESIQRVEVNDWDVEVYLHDYKDRFGRPYVVVYDSLKQILDRVNGAA